MRSYNGEHVVIGGESADGLAIKSGSGSGNVVGVFIGNGSPCSLRLEDDTAWANGGSGFAFDRSASALNRNLSVANGTGVNLGSSGDSGNSWDLKDSWSDADLVSTSTSGIEGPRAADGSIPATEFGCPRDHASPGADFSDDTGGGEPVPGALRRSMSWPPTTALSTPATSLVRRRGSR